MKGILQHGFDLTAISPAGEKHAVIMPAAGIRRWQAEFRPKLSIERIT
jgi:hypothetical protein